MKHSEEMTTKVLAGLRDAEAPAGMEGRILKALQERGTTARSKQSRWRPFWLGAPHLTMRSWTLATAAVGVILAVLASSAKHRAKPGYEQNLLSSVATPHRKEPVKVASVGQPALPPAIAASRTVAVPRKGQILRNREIASPYALQTASYPAPPMPLTEQEKLLIRLIHKGDPIQMAMLDPVQRNARNYAERSEFEHFFEKLGTGENK